MLQTKLDGIDDVTNELYLNSDCILELRVKNHPGVMSHICGLFSRRAFNLEKIICFPIGRGHESKIFLTVNANQSIEQIIKQLMKLEDVIDVCRDNFGYDAFRLVENLFMKGT